MLQDKDNAKKGEIAERRPFDVMVDIDDLFNQFKMSFEDMFRYPHPGSLVSDNRIPTMDVVDLGDNYEINAELPGISKENINIEVTSNGIEISAKEEDVKEEEEKDWIKRERMTQSYYRCFNLPEEIKTDSVDAEMKNGILIIKLPKVEPKPKIESTKINIK